MFPPKVFRGLWANIERMIADGSIRSVEEVRVELSRRTADISQWAKDQPDLFVDLEPNIQQATSDILHAHPQLMGNGKGRHGADPFVIALASVRDGIVVTEEKPTGNIIKPRIPDVCEAVGVRWMRLVQFVEAQGWVF
jgi:hypothetical protein